MVFVMISVVVVVIVAGVVVEEVSPLTRSGKEELAVILASSMAFLDAILANVLSAPAMSALMGVVLFASQAIGQRCCQRTIAASVVEGAVGAHMSIGTFPLAGDASAASEAMFAPTEDIVAMRALHVVDVAITQPFVALAKIALLRGSGLRETHDARMVWLLDWRVISRLIRCLVGLLVLMRSIKEERR